MPHGACALAAKNDTQLVETIAFTETTPRAAGIFSILRAHGSVAGPFEAVTFHPPEYLLGAADPWKLGGMNRRLLDEEQ